MDERHQQYLSRLVSRADDAVAKHGLLGVKAEVVFVLDVSKSMYTMYKSNLVAELASRLLALSLEFDDDGVIPAYAFGDTCRHLADLTKNDFAGWIEREVIRTGSDFQNGCNYAPAIHEVCSYFFPEDWHLPTQEVKVGRIFKKKATLYPTLSAPRALPVYALFVTAGDCRDQEATTDAVRRSSRLPIFWQFVGLQSGKGTPTRFSFLEKLDKLGNTHVDNCGFFEVTDTRNDALLFEGMCSEFPSYLGLPQVAEMLLPAEEGGLTTKGSRGGATQDRGPDTAMRLAFEELTGSETPAELEQRARLRKAAEARAVARRAERSRVNVKATDAAPEVAPKAKSAADTRSALAAAETRNVPQMPDEEAPAPRRGPDRQRAPLAGSPDPRIEAARQAPPRRREPPPPVVAPADPALPESLVRRQRRQTGLPTAATDGAEATRTQLPKREEATNTRLAQQEESTRTQRALQEESTRIQLAAKEGPTRAERAREDLAARVRLAQQRNESTVIRPAEDDDAELEALQQEPTTLFAAQGDEDDDSPQARLAAIRARRTGQDPERRR